MSDQLAHSDNRFVVHNRLNEPAQIRRVYASGSKLRLGPFTIFVLTNNLLVPRICISVAKRHITKATVRNKIKRLVRESFRLSKLKIHNVDIVITVNSPIDKLQMPSLKEQLSKLWARLRT